MEVLDKLIDEGIAPADVGFCSFTRAARREAAERAADRFGVPLPALEREGWFRTLHSVAYRVLGVGKEILAGDGKDTRDWFREAFGEEVILPDDESLSEGIRRNPVQVSLAIWGAARSRLESLRRAWERSNAVDRSIPSLGEVSSIVEHYEQSKTLDHRVDFEDIIGRFVGRRFREEGPQDIASDGELPDVPVWIFDEQQDVTPLLDLAARRLANGPATRFTYLAGDPFQSIYGFAGAHGRLFLDWDVDRERILTTSYRCPAPVLDLGEDILRGCSDYFDRGIGPTDRPGMVSEDWLPDLGALDPEEETLVIARTNYQARTFRGQLTRQGIPWTSTRGSGSWMAPKKRQGLRVLADLASGLPVDFRDWLKVLEVIPARGYLEHGTKSRLLVDGEIPDRERASLWSLMSWGATRELIDRIASNTWPSLVEGGDSFQKVADRWGLALAMKPRIRVGTIHSVKGAEADHVILSTESTRRCSEATRSIEGADEERRIAYVGVTRSRHRLTLARPSGFAEFEIPVPGARVHEISIF
jgi:DNA helicase-2/ATP-dependent DNA helicase PcrA